MVRLKSGDPGIFGSAAEGIAALNASGVRWEIVLKAETPGERRIETPLDGMQRSMAATGPAPRR